MTRVQTEFSQEALWLAYRASSDVAAQHLLWKVRLQGPLERTVLAAAITGVLERQSALRVVFTADSQGVWQQAQPVEPVNLPLVEMSGWEERSRKSHAEYFGSRTYDLATGPLYRFCLRKVAEQDHELLCGFHHIVMDGTSWPVFIEDLLRMLRGNSLEPLETDYFQYCAARRDQQQNAINPGAVEFWRQHCEGTTASWALPFSEAVIEGTPSRQAIQRSRKIPEELRDLWWQAAGELHSSPFRIGMAAFMACMAALTRRRDLSVATTLRGRPGNAFEAIVGQFVNQTIVPAVFPDGLTFRRLAAAVSSSLDESLRHEHCPLTLVMRSLGSRHSTAAAPFTPLAFVWMPAARTEQCGELNITCRRFFLPHVNRDLSVYIERHNTEVTMHWIARDTAISAKQLKRIIRLFEYGFCQMLQQPDTPLALLPLMAAEDLDAIVAAGQGRVRDFPLLNRLERLVHDQVLRTPDRDAVVCGGSRLTYRELEDAAERLAMRLLVHGVGPGKFVPLIMASSQDLLIAELATMKTGAAFVPIAPNWPLERIDSVCEQTGAMVVVADKEVASAWHRKDVFCMSMNGGESTSLPVVSETAQRPMDNRLYCIFTSGTTGEPKGAMNSHRGIVNRLFAMTDLLGTPSDDVVLATSPSTADSLVWQFFWPLIHGGRVVIASRNEALRPDLITALCLTHQITITDFVPTIFSQLVRHLNVSELPVPQLPSLRVVLIGGEEMHAPDVMRFKASNPQLRAFNTYGPSETAIGVLFHEVPDEHDAGTVPIGRPLPNVRAYVLDEHGRLLPLGVPGELCLAGACLGEGYVNNSELTATGFPEIKLSGNQSERVYRTGDLVRLDETGVFHFLGRCDDQVQINGSRVEPAEIETVLQGFPEVDRAAVCVEYKSGRASMLSASIRFRDKVQELVADELRERLTRKLPSYLIPTTFFAVDDLPATANGKLDRRALVSMPRRPLLRHDPWVGDFDGKYGETGRIIKAVLGETLEAPDIDPDADFFLDLGANSLHALQAMIALEERLQVRLPLAALYSHSTARRLADSLVPQQASQSAADMNAEAELAIRLRRSLTSWHGRRGCAQGWSYTLNASGPGQRLFWCCQSFDELLNLSDALGNAFPVTGFRSGHLVVQPLSNEINEIAGWYANEIDTVQPAGSILLGGNCQGATMAHAISRVLESRGRSDLELIFLEHSEFDCCAVPVTLVFGRESHLNPANFDENYRHRLDGQCPAGHSYITIPGTHGSYFRTDTVPALADIVRQRLIAKPVKPSLAVGGKLQSY